MNGNLKWFLAGVGATISFQYARRYGRRSAARTLGFQDYMENHGQVGDPSATDQDRGREKDLRERSAARMRKTSQRPNRPSQAE